MFFTRQTFFIHLPPSAGMIPEIKTPHHEMNTKLNTSNTPKLPRGKSIFVNPLVLRTDIDPLLFVGCLCYSSMPM